MNRKRKADRAFKQGMVRSVKREAREALKIEKAFHRIIKMERLDPAVYTPWAIETIKKDRIKSARKLRTIYEYLQMSDKRLLVAHWTGDYIDDLWT